MPFSFFFSFGLSSVFPTCFLVISVLSSFWVHASEYTEDDGSRQGGLFDTHLTSTSLPAAWLLFCLVIDGLFFFPWLSFPTPYPLVFLTLFSLLGGLGIGKEGADGRLGLARLGWMGWFCRFVLAKCCCWSFTLDGVGLFGIFFACCH